RAAETEPKGKPAKSLIVLWMAGGPSQLETFDPHPGTKISHDSTKAIKTAVKDIRIADNLPLVAEQTDSLSLVRSLVSKEGDHERASYNVKTGFRPDPTLVHPALGAIICHQLSDNVEIPRHVSILPGQFPARGGYLGDQYDAFKTFDPIGPIPDVTPRVSAARAAKRLDDLTNVVETSFARGRIKNLSQRTMHNPSIESARQMMSSDQLKAFDVRQASDSLKNQFGDTPFGRACLAAIQLIEVGVRCVEVTLDGWDTHVNNEALVKGRCEILDPAYAALIKELKARNLFDSTIVLWTGEFGRTPKVNPPGGRDHWPHGFTAALAGGGIAGGRIIGETSSGPDEKAADKVQFVKDPRNVEDLHATILHALSIDFTQEIETPIGRPMALSKGKVIRELLS
ncbi:MAG TPA: DUF1501 domain-containing protein, partial [Pirellulaceae bacterium]|nr:DUF1501 domain-containing protein [Pirellulaceae bacterium]